MGQWPDSGRACETRDAIVIIDNLPPMDGGQRKKAEGLVSEAFWVQSERGCHLGHERELICILWDVDTSRGW